MKNKAIVISGVFIILAISLPIMMVLISANAKRSEDLWLTKELVRQVIIHSYFEGYSKNNCASQILIKEIEATNLPRSIVEPLSELIETSCQIGNFDMQNGKNSLPKVLRRTEGLYEILQ